MTSEGESGPAGADSSPDYARSLSAEGKKWGDHLAVERAREMHSWLDHPSILAHYQERARIGRLDWKEWLRLRLGRSAGRSFELGCGSASLSGRLLRLGIVRSIEGIDASEERIREAERRRAGLGAPGEFRVGDANRVRLEPGRYDLVFASHSFHHFVELERVLEEVRRALSPDGVFLLEEFVGPTQFQWTEKQMEATAALLARLPERYRRFRWGAVKMREGRPSVEEVVAASPFESIRSAEIVPLFLRSFRVVTLRRLGGTIQHLLYNGIIHNFPPEDPEAETSIRAVCAAEDALVDSGLLPSDFMLLVGTAR